MPIEEIKRPLSLPPQNWQVGFGAGPQFTEESSDRVHFGFDPLFIYPYFQLGSRLEYYIPATFKFYFLKNIETKDSIISINGPNCTGTLGCNGFGYSAADGLVFYFGGSIDYKKQLNDNLWLTSAINSNYTTHINDISAQTSFGIGYQISKRFYSTMIPGIIYSNHMFLTDSILIADRKELTYYRTDGNTITFNIPLTFGVNITNRWTIYLKTAYGYDVYGDTQLGALAGFRYIW
jgi:hypothetical protein